MSRTHAIAIFVCLLLPVAAAPGFWLPDNVDREAWALTTCYLRYGMMMEAAQQAELMTGQDPAIKTEVAAYMGEWQTQEKERIRKQLSTVFGDESKDRFAAFVDEFTTAENEGDRAFLEELASALVLGEPGPADYTDFRERVLDQYLSGNLKTASDRLGEVQTWVEAKQSDPDTPPLKKWLADVVLVQRVPASPEAQSPPRRTKPMTDMERLAAMEAPLGEVRRSERKGENPMNAYTAKLDERRAKALEEGQAGMKQVAAERAEAEERYAAKKLAEAQADAEAVKRQAQQYALTQNEALEQRQNSWGNRLKRIVASTISATTGAFTGGIGARAGQEAADALFNL